MTLRTHAPTGALDHGSAIRQLLNEALAESGKTRIEIAARMTELIGQPITKHQLDSWTAESRQAWRFPLEYLPALLAAVEGDSITGWLARQRGGEFITGQETAFTKIGRLVYEDFERKQELAELLSATRKAR